jgi:hypothetical protein
MKDDEKLILIKDFLKYCYTNLGIQTSPKLTLTKSKKYAQERRSFGEYNPSDKSIIVYIGKRNLADIFRTLAHELVHHKQNEMGELTQTSGETGSEHENEANAMAGVLLRDYGKTHSMIYESISNKELVEDIGSYQIYCDMDGVLTDFDRQFDHYFGLEPKEYMEEKGKKPFFSAISTGGEEFWSTMPWMPEGKKLWSKIAKYNPIILTSPGNFKGAKEGKLKWIQENLNPQPKEVIFKLTGHKHEILSGKDEVTIESSILIDDFEKNTKPWIALGGKAILHKEGHSTYKEIDEL